MNLSRRKFLIGFAGTACTALVPAQARNIIQFDGPIVPKTTIWIGGHHGDFDWHPFDARTRADALRQILYYHGHGNAEEVEEMLGLSDKELDGMHLGIERVKKMDGLAVDEIRGHHWIRAGFGACCDRCGSECYDGDGGRAFGTEAVCEECTTLTDLLGGDKWDREQAEERLTEWFLNHDCDEVSVRAQMARDENPDLIPAEFWQKCLAEARAAA